jgi:hypothetical protein
MYHLLHCPCLILTLTDGDEEEDGDEGADASADAANDAAAAAGGQAGGDAVDASTAGSGAQQQQQQLGRADSAADSSAYWSSLLKPRWDVLQRDELEGLELQVRAGGLVNAFSNYFVESKQGIPTFSDSRCFFREGYTSVPAGVFHGVTRVQILDSKGWDDACFIHCCTAVDAQEF